MNTQTFAFLFLFWAGPGICQISADVSVGIDGSMFLTPSKLGAPNVRLSEQTIQLGADIETEGVLSQFPRVAIEADTVEALSKGGKLEFESMTLPSIKYYSENQEIFERPEFEDIREAAAELEKKIELARQPGVMAAQGPTSSLRKEIVELARIASTALSSSVGRIGLENVEEFRVEEIETIARLVSELEREIQLLEIPEDTEFDELTSFEKASYSDGREYSPFIYRRIASNTQGVVGIGERLVAGAGKTSIHCSGVLISENLVLTARHCLYKKRNKQRKTSNIRVVFDDEEDPFVEFTRSEVALDLTNPFEGILAIGNTDAASTSEHLDYALLIIKKPPERKITWVEDGSTSSKSRQLCINTTNLYKDQEIYVVGHPSSRARTVADNGSVLFPYLVDDESYGAINASVLTELLDSARVSNADQQRIEELLNRWRQSYKLRDDGLRVHNSRLFRGQPTLGIKANTHGGNSGGPVFSKHLNHVVGVFRDGQYDRNLEYIAGWEHHERALPIVRFVEDMNIRHPGWLEKHNVCVWGKDDDPVRLWSDDQELQEYCYKACR